LKEKRGGWKYALLFLVIYISVLLILGILFSLLDAIAMLDHQYFLVIFPSIVAMVLIRLISKYWNGWTWVDLGFTGHSIFKEILHGSLLALSLLAAGSLVLYFTGFITWSFNHIGLIDFIFPLLIFISVAIGEEMIFRGYVLNNMLYSFSPTVSLIFSAGIFALFHSMNPGISLLSILNIFAGGLLLGLTYMYKRNLWMPIGFHFAWNFMQGPVLGYPVSGLDFPSVLYQITHGPEIITGGAFGFEGSILQLLVCILGMLYLSFRKQT
jgi:uncharacterized protein